MLNRFLLSAVRISTGLLMSAVSVGAAAQAYPDKAIKIIVPFSPGGGNDYLARDIATMLAARHKQSVVVENRPGAGGTIGSAQVAKSPADGYTLLMAANTAAIVDATRSDQGFSLTKDFKSIGMVADMPMIVVVNPATGIKSVQDLIAQAKREPGALNYASSGPGTVQHMAAALFDALAGTKMQHVPFKGASQMMPELLANRIQVLFGPANSVLPHIRSGGLTALAVTGDKRWEGMPELPTVAETGVKGYKADLWYALLAPAATPPQVINTLSRDLNAYVEDAGTRERFKGQALSPVKTTPAQMDQRMADDVEMWKDIAKKINFKSTDN